MGIEATERVRSSLQHSLDTARRHLDRIEILTAAMSAFSRPIPDYEPAFHHMHHLALTQHEIH
jgi:hypothetical protein